MDADERLTALKKAYADIILNTAKEAAAKIIVSERKALRFQHELAEAKEGALQMLLRLKTMMDSKISEAETTSLSQQGKIEELEAQLQEAEDIVRDLREELRNVQAELERVTNNKIQHLEEHDNATPEEEAMENKLYTSHSIVFPPAEPLHNCLAAPDMMPSNFNLRKHHSNCYTEVINMRNSYCPKPDLPSIISRSKEHKFYRNGCTQRIRACERNLLDGGDLPLSKQPNDVNHERNVEGNEESDSIHVAYADEVDLSNIEKKEVVQANSRFSSWYQARAVRSSRRKRDRPIRSRKSSTPSCKYLPGQLMRLDQASDNPFSKTSAHSVRNDALSDEDLTKMTPKLSSGVLTDMDGQPECADTTKNNAEHANECGADYTINKCEDLINLLVHRGQESGSTESSVGPVSITNLEKIDVPIVDSDSKVLDSTKGIPSQPVNDRIIKFTFQRKRKRQPLSISDGSASLDKSTSKKKSEEKQNGVLEPQKSCPLTESSRDSRRIAQVARQLISLSEKKWWQ